MNVANSAIRRNRGARWSRILQRCPALSLVMVVLAQISCAPRALLIDRIEICAGREHAKSKANAGSSACRRLGLDNRVEEGWYHVQVHLESTARCDIRPSDRPSANWQSAESTVQGFFVLSCLKNGEWTSSEGQYLAHQSAPWKLALALAGMLVNLSVSVQPIEIRRGESKQGNTTTVKKGTP